MTRALARRIAQRCKRRPPSDVRGRAASRPTTVEAITSLDTTAVVHLLGFLTGCALYALLGMMVVRRARIDVRPAEYLADSRLVLATAGLGLLWNVGALVLYGRQDLGIGAGVAWIAALAFAALGFLPAVVVHAALRGQRATLASSYVAAAYLLGGAAVALHAGAALRGGTLQSRPALLLLTVGFVALTLGLALQHRRVGGRTLAPIALAVFAVSALHLGQHAEEAESLAVALVGHHASLPLALAILYQDYRFALADVFLKRALTLVALVAVALAGYVWVVEPLLASPHTAGGLATNNGSPAAAVLFVLWVAITALAYPVLSRSTSTLVDRQLLRRPDYPRLRADVGRQLERASIVDDVLERAARTLAEALGVVVRWQPMAEPCRPAGALVEHVALVAGRRVDALRVSHERCERDVREAEMRRLASEAELSALRAQLDPHFLFNTLNTLGYLMQVDAARAHGVLRHVSDLLRAVLYRSQREHSTLGEELQLVEAYLAEESARFEERLRVVVDVPESLRAVCVPPLLLQPLVENAVKHGIAPHRAGGTVTIRAEVDYGEESIAADAAGAQRTSAAACDADGVPQLRVSVHDTGTGILARQRRTGSDGGVGLANLERRLARYYGEAAGLAMHATPGGGTMVTVWLPAERADGRAGDEPALRGVPSSSRMAPDPRDAVIVSSRRASIARAGAEGAWGPPPDSTIVRSTPVALTKSPASVSVKRTEVGR